VWIYQIRAWRSGWNVGGGTSEAGMIANDFEKTSCAGRTLEHSAPGERILPERIKQIQDRIFDVLVAVKKQQEALAVKKK
jgi:hypothetical protein